MPLAQSKAKEVPCSSKVRRNLFGPLDSHQLQHDFEELMKQHLEEAKQRWNFNFETDTPLEGQFKWERVYPAQQPPQEAPSLVGAISSQSRSSKEQLGRNCPEGSQQSSEVYRVGSSQGSKRGQTTIKEFYSSKRRIIPEKKPKP